MPPILFADNFLAGSYLSLLMPVGLLIVIAIWYVRTVRRFPEDTPASSSSPSRPAPEVLAAADPSVTDANPTDPPAGEL
jgi:hypothetical protein